MKRLIISDLHLGSFYAKEAQLIQFFEENADFDELILAGDIIDFIHSNGKRGLSPTTFPWRNPTLHLAPSLHCGENDDDNQTQ